MGGNTIEKNEKYKEKMDFWDISCLHGIRRKYFCGSDVGPGGNTVVAGGCDR